MEMSVKVTGVEELQNSIDSLISQLGMPYQEVYPQEAKLLAEEMMKRTPPYPGGDAAGSNSPDARRGGEITVKGDIDRSQTPIDIAFEGVQTNKWLRKIIRAKDVEKLKQAFLHIPRMKAWTVAPFSPQYHKRYRGNAGKRYHVRNSSKVMTLDNAKQKAYVKEKQKDVGFMKSGWGITVSMLQGRVPAWISRNFGQAPGGLLMNLADDNPQPYLRFWNNAPTIGKYNTAFEYAVAERVRSIGVKVNQALERRMKKIFKG